MNQTVETVVNAVTIFLSSSVGATVLGLVVKVAIEAYKSIKTKKYSKLTEEDKREIAEMSAKMLYEQIKGGVSIDMDAQMDKATARRITAVEKLQNDIIENINELMRQQRVVLSAIGDFKTISQSSKEQIQKVLGAPVSKLPALTVVEQPMLQIKQVEQSNPTAEIKEPTVRY